MPKGSGLSESLIAKLEAIAVVFLMPVFFAYSGLRTEIGLVSQPDQWLATLAIIVLATVGKFGGGAVAARLSGLRWREASAIGILMNTRGLMELVVLNIGFDMGIISPTLFTMLVIMALVTTFATAPILRWVYPDHEVRRDMAPGLREAANVARHPIAERAREELGAARKGAATAASARRGSPPEADAAPKKKRSSKNSPKEPGKLFDS